MMNANEYFLSRRPDAGPERSLYTRIATAMEIYGNVTMNRLCEMSEKELKRVRGIGEKARVVVLDECRNYLDAKNS